MKWERTHRTRWDSCRFRETTRRDLALNGRSLCSQCTLSSLSSSLRFCSLPRRLSTSVVSSFLLNSFSLLFSSRFSLLLSSSSSSSSSFPHLSFSSLCSPRLFLFRLGVALFSSLLFCSFAVFPFLFSSSLLFVLAVYFFQLVFFIVNFVFLLLVVVLLFLR